MAGIFSGWGDSTAAERDSLPSSPRSDHSPYSPSSGAVGAGAGLGAGGGLLATANYPLDQPGPDTSGNSMRGLNNVLDERDDDQDSIYIPMDPINIYESTYDLDARLADHCRFERRAMKKPPEHITMEDVQGEMDELKTEKEQDESIKEEIKRSLESLAKKTVVPDTEGRKDRALTAARICQIENRLQTDPSLRFDDEMDGSKGMPWNADEAARQVKRSLIKIYGKIQKSSNDLSQVAQHQLDRRIQILNKVRLGTSGIAAPPVSSGSDTMLRSHPPAKAGCTGARTGSIHLWP